MKNGYRKPNTGPLIHDAANSVDLYFEELSHLLNETQHIFLSWLTFREFLWFLVNDSTLLSGPFDDHLAFIKAKIQQQYVFVAPVSYIS